ncbi:MAG: glycosyltransferase [Candidatus Cloacimonetes bacterium]|nr:glycosyltransferase [Candidatus Cloacimonadota bacterium]
MKLAFLFTRKISLKTWIDSGLFGREKLIYEKLIEDKFCEQIYWFTYGVDDYKYQDLLPLQIEVVSMPSCFQSKLGMYLYSFLLPFLYFSRLSSVQMVKTNQMEGSWTGVIIRFLYNCKLYIRTGYTWSQLLEDSSSGSKLHRFSILVERLAYKYCDLASVSSYHNQSYLKNMYPEYLDNLFVLGNFIDTKCFQPVTDVNTRCEDRLLFIGRLNKEKNLKPLLEAVSSLGLGLDLYGSGDQETELKSYAETLSKKIVFHGLIANEKLVDIYNDHKYYVLTSHAEGMPKTLIEAMACGCICIGTNVLGINELIVDQKTGFLTTKTSSESIKSAIEKAIQSKEHQQISLKASSYIQTNFSLDAVYELEKSYIQKVVI